MKKKDDNNKNVVIIAGIFIIIAIFALNLLTGNHSKENNKVLKINEVNANIEIQKLSNLEEYTEENWGILAFDYNRIKVSIKNNDNNTFAFNSLLYGINLLDKDKNKITSADIFNISEGNIFQLEVEGNNTKEGYIYFLKKDDIDVSKAKYIEFKIPTNMHEENGIVKFDQTSYYLEIDNK